MIHQYLKQKLTSLWRPKEKIIHIYLVSEYYIVKFLKEENWWKGLLNGPWVFNGIFLLIKKWYPNFVASKLSKQLS